MLKILQTFYVVLIILSLNLSFSKLMAKDQEADSLKTVLKGLEYLQKSGKLDAKGKLTLGRVYFYLAVEDKTMLEKGENYFQAIQSDFKPEASAYLAALEAIRAKNAIWPNDKWNIANSALSKMDKAVETWPDNIEVRFVRASTCYYLPFFFNRKDQVKSDFIVLSKLIPSGYNAYPNHLIRNICDFILKSEYLPESQAKRLKSFYQESVI